MTHVGIIAESSRAASQSLHIAGVCRQLLATRECFVEKPLDLSQTRLPDAADEQAVSVSPEWQLVSQSLNRCDSVVFIVLEWSGIAPPALKNFMLPCSKRQLAHKPALLRGHLAKNLELASEVPMDPVGEVAGRNAGGSNSRGSGASAQAVPIVDRNRSGALHAAVSSDAAWDGLFIRPRFVLDQIGRVVELRRIGGA